MGNYKGDGQQDATAVRAGRASRMQWGRGIGRNQCEMKEIIVGVGPADFSRDLIIDSIYVNVQGLDEFFSMALS